MKTARREFIAAAESVLRIGVAAEQHFNF